MESSDILAPLRNEDDYQQRMGTLYRRTINQTTTVIQMPLNAQKLVTPTPSDHISQRGQYFFGRTFNRPPIFWLHELISLFQLHELYSLFQLHQ